MYSRGKLVVTQPLQPAKLYDNIMIALTRHRRDRKERQQGLAFLPLTSDVDFWGVLHETSIQLPAGTVAQHFASLGTGARIVEVLGGGPSSQGVDGIQPQFVCRAGG